MGRRGWPVAAGEALRRPGGRGGSAGSGKPSSFRNPVLPALAAAGLILAVAGLFLYLRKRRQVAAHFTMAAAAREAEAKGSFREPVPARA